MAYLFFPSVDQLDEVLLLGACIHLGISAEEINQFIADFPSLKENQVSTLPEAEINPQGIRVQLDSARFETLSFSLSSCRKILLENPRNGEWKDRAEKTLGLLEAALESSSGRAELKAGQLASILGFTFALEKLGIKSIFFSSLPLGGASPGGVKELAELYRLAGVPVRLVESPQPGITRTGAALLAGSYHPAPPVFFLRQAGRGISRDSSGKILSLEAILCGEPENEEIDAPMTLIQTNMDDMSPQLLSGTISRLFDAGALDVYQIPVYMKKNRLGIQLNVVIRRGDEEKMAQMILRETSTLGVSLHPMDHRYHAETRKIEVNSRFGPISAKQKWMGGKVIQTKPEFEDLLNASRKYQVPLEEIIRAVDQALEVDSQSCQIVFQSEEKK